MAKSRHSLLIKSLVALLALFVCSMLFLAATNTHEEVAGLAAATDKLSETFRFFRWAALVLLITFWDNVVDIYASMKELSDEQSTYAKTMQWRVGALLVAFDLIVIEGLPAKLMGLI